MDDPLNLVVVRHGSRGGELSVLNSNIILSGVAHCIYLTHRCHQVMQESEWRLGQELVRQFWFDEDGASWVLQNIQRGIPVLPHYEVIPD